MPGDSLTIITPSKTYHIKDQAINRLPVTEIVRQLDRILLRDIKRTGREIKSLIRDIEELYTKTGAFEWEHGDHTLQIRECLEQIEALRAISEERLLNFSDFLKNKNGQKNVFLFYQNEMVPRLGPYMDGMRSTEIGTDVPFKVFQYLELGGWYRQGVFFDVKKVKRIFSDSSIHIHFLYLTKHPIHAADVSRLKPLSADDVRYEELTENFFSAFKEVSAATGGYMASSYNAAAVFQKAVEASENYYLLYYTPSDYRENGKFRNLRVKVRGKSYRVSHRSGYLAD